ncbi:MAG: hypothetical protein QRY72_01755 [Candidatus Rhabdochlamydia sp.]
MVDRPFLYYLDYMIENPKINMMGNLEEFVDESLDFFHQIQKNITSSQGEEKTAFLHELHQAREKFAHLAHSLYAKTQQPLQKGLTATSLSSQESAIFHQIQDKINRFKTNLHSV